MTPSPAAPPFDAERAIRMACQTLRIEAEALLQLQDQQGAGFAAVVETILRSSGRVVVMGMGKSGHVGR